MKKILFILFFAVLLFPAVVFAKNIIDDIEGLEASGKMSNGTINHSVVEYVYLPQGTVTTYVYQGDNENLTIKYFDNVAIQDEMSVRNKVTRFVFELTNRYRPYDTDLALSTSKTPKAIDIYTSGSLKDEAIWNVVNGIPDALANKPIAPGEDGYVEDWVDKWSPQSIDAGGNDSSSDDSSGGSGDETITPTVAQTQAIKLGEQQVQEALNILSQYLGKLLKILGFWY